MKKKNQLKIIKGGLLPLIEAEKVFVSAFASKSRLMGCIWVCANWQVINSFECKDLTQYFYIDCDQFGIEDFHNLCDPSKAKIKIMDTTTIDCMGSDRVSLDEASLKALIKKYHDFTIEKGQKLHKDWKFYEFILETMPIASLESNLKENHLADKKVAKKTNFLLKKIKDNSIDKTSYIPLSKRLTESRLDKLTDEINLNLYEYGNSYNIEDSLCTKPTNTFGLINYFLMRFFAKDIDILKSFYDASLDLSMIRSNFDFLSEHNLLLKNDIKDIGKRNAELIFSCKSIIQGKISCHLVHSIIYVKDKKIVDFKITQTLQISSKELVLMLKSPEYIILYNLDMTYLPLTNMPLYTKIPMTESSYENAYMYMAFKNDNDHVLSSSFNMSHDIYGTYILTLTNQIAICASSLEHVNKLKDNLLSMPIGKYLTEVSTAYFDISSSFEFINSEYFDFSEFLDSFSSDETEDY